MNDRPTQDPAAGAVKSVIRQYQILAPNPTNLRTCGSTHRPVVNFEPQVRQAQSEPRAVVKDCKRQEMDATCPSKRNDPYVS